MTDFKFWTLVSNLKLWPQMAILGYGHKWLFWVLDTVAYSGFETLVANWKFGH